MDEHHEFEYEKEIQWKYKTSHHDTGWISYQELSPEIEKAYINFECNNFLQHPIICFQKSIFYLEKDVNEKHQNYIKNLENEKDISKVEKVNINKNNNYHINFIHLVENRGIDQLPIGRFNVNQHNPNKDRNLLIPKIYKWWYDVGTEGNPIWKLFSQNDFVIMDKIYKNYYLHGSDHIYESNNFTADLELNKMTFKNEGREVNLKRDKEYPNPNKIDNTKYYLINT